MNAPFGKRLEHFAGYFQFISFLLIDLSNCMLGRLLFLYREVYLEDGSGRTLGQTFAAFAWMEEKLKDRAQVGPGGKPPG